MREIERKKNAERLLAGDKKERGVGKGDGHPDEGGYLRIEVSLSGRPGVAGRKNRKEKDRAAVTKGKRKSASETRANNKKIKMHRKKQE